MPLTGSGTTWANAILAGIDTTGLSADEITTITNGWINVCNIHASHIVANTLVAVTSVSAVTPGVGVSGPGAGTVT